MKRRAWRLWSWISVWMIVLAWGAVAFVMSGMTVWYWQWWAIQERNLPPSVLNEMHKLENNNPDSPRLEQIYEQYFEYPTERGDFIAVVLLSAATLPFVACVGILIARRLSQPLTDITQAAMDVAAGRFTVRLNPERGIPLELRHLTNSFNIMTERLQRYERELHNSSAAVAHELRTPLTAAKARLQGMIDGVFDCEPAQLKKIMLQLDSLSQLVNDLHSYSMMLAGKIDFVFTEVGLRDLVQERCEWAQAQLQAEAMTVHNEVDEGISVYADGHRLGQVLSILVDNAIRYAASGLTIEFRADSIRNVVQLRVLDRGPGIAHEQLARVFERFWRAESSRSRHAGGSGLGLAIATAICAAHGGSITAVPREGGGTEMVVTLPKGRS